mgnify:CR=1 FL=1
MYMSPRNAFSRCEEIVTAMFAVPATVGRLDLGLIYDTRIATPLGPRPVDAIAPGDTVQDAEGRTHEVLRVMRRTYGAELARIYPEGLVLLPKGTLGVTRDTYLPAEQPLHLTTPTDAETTGAAPLCLRAGALAGHGAVQVALPVDGLTVTRLVFAAPVRLRVEAGLTALCPAARQRPPVLADAEVQPVLAQLIPTAPPYVTDDAPAGLAEVA